MIDESNANANNDNMTLEMFANVTTDRLKDIVRYAFKIVPSNPEKYQQYISSRQIKVPSFNDDQELSDNLAKNIKNIISFYKLDIDYRHQIIDQVSLQLEKDREYPPDFFAITLVQSFGSMLLYNIDEIPLNYFSDFLNGFRLGWSCLPLHHYFCSKLFIIFYSKYLLFLSFLKDNINKNDGSSENNSNNDLFIKKLNLLTEIDKTAAEFAHCFLGYTSALLESCTILFKMVDYDNLDEYEPILSAHNKFILKAINWKSAENNKFAPIISTNLVITLPMIKKEKLQFAYQLLTFLIHFIEPDSENILLITQTIENFIHESILFPSLMKASSKERLSEELKLSYFEFLEKPLEIKERLNLNNFIIDVSDLISSIDRYLGENSIIRSFVSFFNSLSRNHANRVFDFLYQICKPKIESGNLNFLVILLLYIHGEEHRLDAINDFFENHPNIWSLFFNNLLFDPNVSIFNHYLSLHSSIKSKSNIIIDDNDTKQAHLLLLLRSLLFDDLKKIIKAKPANDTISSIINYINSIMDSCALFTEVFLYFADKFLGNVEVKDEHLVTLIELLANEIPIQQQIHIRGNSSAKNANIFRPILFSLISMFSIRVNLADIMFVSKSFVKSFFSIIFEPDIFDYYFQSVSDISFNFLQNVEKYFDDMQSILRQILSNIQNKINDQRIIPIIFNFILILQFYISDTNSVFLRLLVKSQIFEDFCKMISMIPKFDEAEHLLLLILHVFELFSHSTIVDNNSIPYLVLLAPLQNNKMTDNIYNLLKQLVCYPNTQFNSLENSSILPLLVFSTENTKYFTLILEELCTICRDSIWNCFSVFKSEILVKLLEKIDQNILDQNITELILRLFCYVNIFVSSRQLLYAFTRLFHVFDSREISPNLEIFINYFRTVFTTRSHIPPSFIHFASDAEYVEMRSPPIKELMNGFTISVWLLLDSFNDENNAFSVLFFKGESASMNFYLTKNQLCVMITNNNNNNCNHNSFVEIGFPKLEWFNLTIQYDKDKGSITPFVNGRQKKSIENFYLHNVLQNIINNNSNTNNPNSNTNTNANALFDEFSCLQFHGEPNKSFRWMSHGQLSLFAIFLREGNNVALASNPTSFAENIYKFGAEGVYSILSLPNVYALFSAFRAKAEGIMINYKDDSSSSYSPLGNATFKGSICTFVASFCQVFESSSGTSFVTALWSKVNLKYSNNGQEEKRLISWFTQVMETVCQNSEISQSQFVQINATQIISYFIRKLPIYRISPEIWSCFLRLFNKATNVKLKRAICDDILLNATIWEKASFENAVGIFELWRTFIQANISSNTQSGKNKYCEKLSIPFLIDILKHYCSLFSLSKNNNNNNNNMSIDNKKNDIFKTDTTDKTSDYFTMISHTLCICMYEIAVENFSVDDASVALSFCISIQSSITNPQILTAISASSLLPPPVYAGSNDQITVQAPSNTTSNHKKSEYDISSSFVSEYIGNSLVHSMLKLFENVFFRNTKINPFTFYDILIQSIPFIFKECDSSSREVIIGLFWHIYNHQNNNLSIMTQFLYSVIQQKSATSQTNEYECTEKDPENGKRNNIALFFLKYFISKATSSNSEEIKATSQIINNNNTDNVITNTSSLFIAFFSAIFCTKADRQILTSFSGKISALPENQEKVAQELDEYSIMTLVFYGVVVENSIIPFISAFLFRNIQKLITSFRFIDALERFTNTDYLEQLDNLIIYCIPLLVANPSIRNRNRYFILFMNKMLFHRKVNNFSWSNRNKQKGILQTTKQSYSLNEQNINKKIPPLASNDNDINSINLIASANNTQPQANNVDALKKDNAYNLKFRGNSVDSKNSSSKTSSNDLYLMSKEFNDFLAIFIGGFEFEPVQYSFGVLIQKGVWANLTLAKSILQLLIIILNENSSSVDPKMIATFIFCITNSKIDYSSYLSLISQIIGLMGPNFIPEPLLLNISRSKTQPKAFLQKHFNVSSISPNLQLFTKVTEIISETSKSFPLIIDCNSQSVLTSVRDFFADFAGTQKNLPASLNSVIRFSKRFTRNSLILLSNINSNNNKKEEEINKMNDESDSDNSDRAWRRLVHKLRNEMSPYITSTLKNAQRHYKRPSLFDFRFRPILLTPNGHFDTHSEASREVSKDESSENDEKTSSNIKSTDSFSAFETLKDLNSNIYNSRIGGNVSNMNRDGSYNNDLNTLANSKEENENLFDESNQIWTSNNCVKTTVNNKKSGTFSVFSKGYRFDYSAPINAINNNNNANNSSSKKEEINANNKRSLFLKNDSILYIFWRWNLQIPNSVEIFMDDHKNYFFTFPNETNHTFITKYLTRIQLPNKIFVQTKNSQTEISSLHLTEKWVDHQISTFDYLMMLNMFSGRSFLNPTCYPVFPWIVVDYASPSLNTSSEAIYRNFRLPIGALNKQSLDNKKERILAQQEEYELQLYEAQQQQQQLMAQMQQNGENLNESSSFTNSNLVMVGGIEKENLSNFLFQTGYSNEFIITYYLLRIEPFTTLHISLFDGHYDNPNRQFVSVPDSFNMLITTNSTFRELVPEFFYLPEFLVNDNKFNFGTTLKNNKVDNVDLPKWSSNPADFVHKHLLALESDECGKEIHNWIDLIWGYKQSGEAAVEADNTFDPHMYANREFDEDDMRTNHVRELIGQIPIQLFESEHPKRHSRAPKRPLPSIPQEAIRCTLSSSSSSNNNNISGSNNGNNNSSLFVTALNYEGNSAESLKIYSIHKDGKVLCTKGKGTTHLMFTEVMLPTDPRFISTAILTKTLSSSSSSDIGNDHTFTNSLFNYNYTEYSNSNSNSNNSSNNNTSNNNNNISSSNVNININYYTSTVTFACVLNDGSGLLVFQPSTMKKPIFSDEKPHIAAINCVSISNKYVITGGCDASVVLWKWSNKKSVSVIAQSDINNETITCVTVSNLYGIAVSCTRAGIMTVFRLPHLDFIRTVELKIPPEAVPNKVVITKGIGNIIVFCESETSLNLKERYTMMRSFSVNGLRLGSARFELKVTDVLTISDAKMRDFLLVLTDPVELLLVDAFNLDIISTVYQAAGNCGGEGSSRMTKIAYREDTGIIILANDNSDFVFIPFVI